MEKYSKDFKCRNCGAWAYLQIPKGESVDTYLNEHLTNCQRCGVRLGKVVEDSEQDDEENNNSEEKK
jgi:transcription elongation factor Elf1